MTIIYHQPKRVPTLCESLGIPEDEPIGSIAERYSAAIRAYIAGEIVFNEMWRIVSAKACLPDRRRS